MAGKADGSLEPKTAEGAEEAERRIATQGYHSWCKRKREVDGWIQADTRSKGAVARVDEEGEQQHEVLDHGVVASASESSARKQSECGSAARQIHSSGDSMAAHDFTKCLRDFSEKCDLFSHVIMR